MTRTDRCPERRLATAAIVVALAGFGACREPISDTGFVGAWQRGKAGGSRAVLAIWQDDTGYHAHVNRFGPDGEHLVRCEQVGACLAYSGRDPQFEIRYRAYESDEFAGLVIERQVTPLFEGGKEAHNLDRFVLAPGGLELSMYMVERDHRRREREGGPVRFHTIADDPFHF